MWGDAGGKEAQGGPSGSPQLLTGGWGWTQEEVFFLGGIVRPWQGLPREFWSGHPRRYPGKAWMWHLGCGHKVRIGLSGLGGLFQPRDL